MQCYAPSKLSWYTPFGGKKMEKDQLRICGCSEIRPGIHMAWVGCGLALNVAELQAMQVMHACYVSSQLFS